MSSQNARKNRDLVIKVAIGSTVTILVGGIVYYAYRQRILKEQINDGNLSSNKTGSCCGNGMTCNPEDKKLKNIVLDRYSTTARNFTSNQQKSADKMAEVFGYTQQELDEFGADSNMGLACGNPVAQASIKNGEVVMDLGCGGGFDCFLALKKVGKTGKVIGIDMSKDMIDRATNNAIKKGYNIGDINDITDDNVNISFYNTEIENMEEINDNFVNCIISNCVLNLVPNKLNAFKEIYRVLQGNNKGRLAISDIAFKKAFPKEMNDDAKAYVAGYVNCISGAILKDEYNNLLKQAGFKQIKFVEKKVDLNVWKSGWESGGDSGGCCGVREPESTSQGGCCGSTTDNSNNNNNNDNKKAALTFTNDELSSIQKKLKNININDYVGSYYIFAIK